jgi:ABC-2 type transport system permease protein
VNGLVRRGLRAEWTKLRSVRSTTWTVVAVVAVTVGVTAFLAANGGTDANQAGGVAGDDDVVVNSLRGVWIGQVPLVALGVVAMTSEFASGTIRTTFAALPRRRSTLAAKATTVGLVALAVGSAASVLSFLIAQPLLHDGGYVGPAYPVVALTDAPVIRAVAGTAIYLTLLALFAVGVAGIVRHTATAMTLVVALVLVPSVLMESFPRQRIRELLEQVFPAGGLSIQVTSERYHTPPFGTWGGLGVTAAWALAAMLGAAWTIGRRDV